MSSKYCLVLAIAYGRDDYDMPEYFSNLSNQYWTGEEIIPPHIWHVICCHMRSLDICYNHIIKQRIIISVENSFSNMACSRTSFKFACKGNKPELYRQFEKSVKMAMKDLFYTWAL